MCNLDFEFFEHNLILLLARHAWKESYKTERAVVTHFTWKSSWFNAREHTQKVQKKKKKKRSPSDRIRMMRRKTARSMEKLEERISQLEEQAQIQAQHLLELTVPENLGAGEFP